ncbi:hypothetical protein TNCV_321761 [Trichonephila clavipes]|nr:hypothetical protein TNCV_321761 [Trichonephila clavipes]
MPQSTIHLQTSMPFPGFEPRPYGTAVSVADHYTRWVTTNILGGGSNSYIKINLLDWSDTSPDLNLMENVWKHLEFFSVAELRNTIVHMHRTI